MNYDKNFEITERLAIILTTKNKKADKMEYELATTEVQDYLRNLGYNDLTTLSSLDDDTDSNYCLIYRWSFIVGDVDYTVEYFTVDASIDLYDCLNA
jgi:hypothetical protein